MSDFDIANWTAERLRKMHEPIVERQFMKRGMEVLTPHQYLTKEIEANFILKSDVVRAITKTREIYLTSNTARQRKSADVTANDWEVLRELILKDLGL